MEYNDNAGYLADIPIPMSWNVLLIEHISYHSMCQNFAEKNSGQS